MFDKKYIEDSGVSPVIGVILMVAVTVALVALVTLVVFDIGGNTSEPADISLNIDVVESPGPIQVDVIRNENVDTLTARVGDKNATLITQTGGVGTFTVSPNTDDSTDPRADKNLNASGDSGTLELVAEVGDNEEIVQTVDYDFS